MSEVLFNSQNIVREKTPYIIDLAEGIKHSLLSYDVIQIIHPKDLNGIILQVGNIPPELRPPTFTFLLGNVSDSVQITLNPKDTNPSYTEFLGSESIETEFPMISNGVYTIGVLAGTNTLLIFNINAPNSNSMIENPISGTININLV
jgi:hypothetical protein